MLAGWCQFGFCCLSYKQTLLIVFKIINISEPLICFVCDIGSMALRTEKEYESSYNKYNDNFIGQRNSKWQFNRFVKIEMHDLILITALR